MAEIKLVGPEIKGRAGEKVRLEVEFAKKCYACVHERREGKGYYRICDQQTDKLVYDAVLSDNTTDFIISTKDTDKPHLNFEGNTGQIWCPVTIVKDGQTPEPEPEPEPEKVELGEYLFSVCLLTDQHMCKSNDNVTPKDDSDNWGDEKDFTRCLDLCVADKNVKCLMSCGDMAESQTNDDQKHPEATCDADYAEVKEMYDVTYWQKQGLRLFSPLGNHDFYGLFESRQGDEIKKAKNSETTFGYNANVNKRISALWPTGQQINGIVPGRGRIVFELESGKKTASGQADMNFFSYNDYVDLYARKGGYTGTSIWDSKKGGISDEAIKCAKSYVNQNWAAVKDKLIMWNDSGSHGRNGYSKLSYWLKKDNNIFIFLSVDYGNDTWGVTSGWHDRMIRARTLIDLNSDDPYVRRLLEYVADTGYSKADEPYNYQYYSVNSLIWLLEIVEQNQGKKLIGFTHHFLPNRSGNGAGVPKEGNWQYADIHPSDEKDTKEGGIYPVGSNALTGITFWFFEKLLRTHKNLMICTGHSHVSWESGINFDNHTYKIVSPAEKSKYVYTKASEEPVAETGWTVALPSMSKPRNIVNGQSVRRYEDAEMAIMEIYERGVKIKGYKVREDNKDVNKLLVEKEIQLI